MQTPPQSQRTPRSTSPCPCLAPDYLTQKLQQILQTLSQQIENKEREISRTKTEMEMEIRSKDQVIERLARCNQKVLEENFRLKGKIEEAERKQKLREKEISRDKKNSYRSLLKADRDSTSDVMTLDTSIRLTTDLVTPIPAYLVAIPQISKTEKDIKIGRIAKNNSSLAISSQNKCPNSCKNLFTPSTPVSNQSKLYGRIKSNKSYQNLQTPPSTPILETIHKSYRLAQHYPSHRKSIANLRIPIQYQD